jgi:hypothetical protein
LSAGAHDERSAQQLVSTAVIRNPIELGDGERTASGGPGLAIVTTLMVPLLCMRSISVLDLGHGWGLMDRAATERKTAELVAEYGSPNACPGVLLCDRHPGDAVAFTVVEPEAWPSSNFPSFVPLTGGCCRHRGARRRWRGCVIRSGVMVGLGMGAVGGHRDAVADGPLEDR